jgi:hemerythrin-like domain-containing protein
MESSTKKTTQRNSTTQDATALLRADHKHVSGLFAEYKKARSSENKKDIVAKICKELTVHAQIEEEIFYPAVQQALKDKTLVPEATVEHATLKALVAQVEGAEPDSEMFDAKIEVMSEYVQHHVKEEQNEMFPKAKASKMDLMELGEQLAERKAELLAQQPEQGSSAKRAKSPSMNKSANKSAPMNSSTHSTFPSGGMAQEKRMLKHRRTADHTL